MSIHTKHGLYLLIALLTFFFGIWLTPRYTELKCGYVEKKLAPGEFDPDAGLEDAVKGGDNE